MTRKAGVVEGGAGSRRKHSADGAGKRPKRRNCAGRPPGAVSEETRARIIDAACRCFAEHGYSNASNQDIARMAGLTTGALYHYFGSKAELFAAVHRHVQEVLVGLYRRAFAEEDTCVAQLCAGLDAAVELTAEQPLFAHFASIAALEIQRHPELSAVLETDTQGVREFFAHLFAEGRKRGEIAPETSTDAVVNLVVSTLFGLAWLRAQVQRSEEYAAAIRAFQLLLQGALFRV